MKKLMFGMLSAGLLLGLTACGEQPAGSGTKKPASSVSAVLQEQTAQAETESTPEAPADTQQTDEKPPKAPQDKPEDRPKQVGKFDKIDLDLSGYSSTMLFAEMYNMTLMPEDYDGKIIKIKGQFSSYQKPKTKEVCYIVFCMDATACCGQAMDFILQDPSQHPENEIESDAEITVVGRFEIYEENADYGIASFRLVDAYLE